MCQTDPLRSQLAIVRFAGEFASVIPLNDQKSGKKATETSPVMFGRRIAKWFVVAAQTCLCKKSPACLFIENQYLFHSLFVIHCHTFALCGIVLHNKRSGKVKATARKHGIHII